MYKAKIKISSKKDLERFVTKFEHMVPKTNNSNIT